MSDDHVLRLFVSNWKAKLLAVKRNTVEMDAFFKEVFDQNAKFSSPAIHKPSSDPIYIKTILKWIIEIVEDFHYTDVDYYDHKTNRLAMTFAGKVLDAKSNKYRQVEGVDFIQLNENASKVIELKVMVRPLNSLMIVANAMKSRFRKLSKY